MVAKLREGQKSSIEGVISERRLVKRDGKSCYVLKIADIVGKELTSTVSEDSPIFERIGTFPKGHKVSAEVTLEDAGTCIGFIHSLEAYKTKPVADKDEYRTVFKKTILGMTNLGLKRLVVSLINESWFNEKFLTASDVGYSYSGGLLERTLKLISLMHENVDFFERHDNGIQENFESRMSKDLLTMAVIFIQSAKAYLFEDDARNLSLEKLLTNETQMALRLLDGAIQDVGSNHSVFFSNEQKLAIQHLLTCGGSMTPKTKEASMFAHVLQLESQMVKFDEKSEDVVVLNYLELKSPPIVKITKEKPKEGDVSVNAENEFD